jgi:TolB-like protein
VNLFGELKRRNVFRVGIAYAIVGWLIIQVADIVLENIGAPVWVMQTIFLLIALGFVAALLFAWVFEATPEGIKRQSEIDRSQSITHVTGRKLDRTILLMLVVALGYFIWESRVAKRAPAEVTTDASVAVLAFENMSPDPENAFFAEGVSEEILNVLAAVDGLRVASRTSAFSFADSDTPIPEIASQLEVAHVLEGSVRKQGSRVRITAQLIDASSDIHLWSETYDRQLNDIFAVQEEIAGAIAEALIGALGITQVDVAAPTRDMLAYELYLRGRQQFYLRGDVALKAAVADFRAAVERDPEFADAWAFLAASEYILTGYASMDDATYEDHVRRSLAAADRALELNPDSALTVAVQGQVEFSRDAELGMSLTRRAAEMAPEDAGILMWAGDDLLTAGGYFDEALPYLEKAYRLDPLSGINNGTLGMAYVAAGRRDLGYRHIRRGIELGWQFAAGNMVIDLLSRGENESALDELRRAHWPPDESAWTAGDQMSWGLAEQAVRGELSGDWRTVFESVPEVSAGYVRSWDLLFIAGDPDVLFDYWMGMRKDLVSYLNRRLYVPGPRTRAVMEHPRMLEMAEIYGLLPVWERKGFPFGCVRVQSEQGDHLSCPNWPQ